MKEANLMKQPEKHGKDKRLDRSPNRSYITLSINESRITDLKTGRSGLIEQLDERKLSREIIAGSYDFIRIRACADDVYLFKKLSDLGFPYHVYNIQTRNIKVIGCEDGKFMMKKGIKYEVIEKKHKIFLKEIVKETILNDAGINYNSRMFSKLIPVEKRLKAAIDYVFTFFQPNSEKKIGWVLKVGNEYAGFCICQHDPENIEGLLYGIKKQFQGKGFSGILIKIVKKFGFENNLKTLSNNVVLQNRKSLKSMANEGVLPSKIYFNVFLFPLLSKNKRK